MPNPINLRLARKAKVRKTKEQVAAQNRSTFGQTKAQKDLTKARTNFAERQLDNLRLDVGDTT